MEKPDDKGLRGLIDTVVAPRAGESSEGRRASLRLLVERLTPPIQTSIACVLLSHGGHGPGAQDVADVRQLVFEKLLRDQARLLRTWDAAVGPIDPWVATIARNTAIDWVKSKRREVPCDEVGSERLDETRPVDVAMEIRDEAKKILAAVREAFSPIDAYLFESLVLLDRDFTDLARETGLSVGNLQVKKHRLIRRARAIALALGEVEP